MAPSRMEGQETPRETKDGLRPIGVSLGRGGPKSGETQVFKYFLWYHVSGGIVALEKRMVLKFGKGSSGQRIETLHPLVAA